MKISKEYHAILNGDVNTSINNIVYDTVVKIVNESEELTSEELTNENEVEQVEQVEQEQVEQVEQSSELTNEVKEATPIKEVGKKGRPAKK